MNSVSDNIPNKDHGYMLLSGMVLFKKNMILPCFNNDKKSPTHVGFSCPGALGSRFTWELVQEVGISMSGSRDQGLEFIGFIRIIIGSSYIPNIPLFQGGGSS